MSSLTDFNKNDRNTNKGNDKGRDFLKRTISANGWASALTADNVGNVLDGNHRLDIAREQGVEPIIVRTDGRRPVIVQREDVDPDSPTAEVLKTAINRSADLNHNYDYSVLEATIETTGTPAEEFGFSAQEVAAGAFTAGATSGAAAAGASSPDAEGPAGPAAPQNTAAKVPESFQIMVECADEPAQQELYDRLTGEGFKCRVLTL